jgi:hypothetical protein
VTSPRWFPAAALGLLLLNACGVPPGKLFHAFHLNPAQRDVVWIMYDGKLYRCVGGGPGESPECLQAIDRSPSGGAGIGKGGEPSASKPPADPPPWKRGDAPIQPQ